METKQKILIRSKLAEYIHRYPSQNMAANSLRGASSATISAIINNKFDKISDHMWNKIAAQLDLPSGWTITETSSYKALMEYFEDARNESGVMWITGPAGIGKSTAAAIYAKDHKEVFVLTCSEDMHKPDFIRELAARIGISTFGMSVRETLAAIINNLMKMDTPLLIFDEGDKLADAVLYYYISLYNALEDKCGMVFLSTGYMKERMSKGLSYAKKGYEELDSRIGRKFVPLDLVSAQEVAEICKANGLEDPISIRQVQKDAAQCGNDLRRVKKSVHKELRKLEIMSK